MLNIEIIGVNKTYVLSIEQAGKQIEKNVSKIYAVRKPEMFLVPFHSYDGCLF